MLVPVVDRDWARWPYLYYLMEMIPLDPTESVFIEYKNHCKFDFNKDPV